MTKRYDLSREYRGNIGSPAITEQPEGAYVLYDDYAAELDELRAEKAGLEAIVAGQAGEIGRLREALNPALGHIRAASIDYGPDANLDEAELLLSAALTQQEQGK